MHGERRADGGGEGGWESAGVAAGEEGDGRSGGLSMGEGLVG